MESDIKSVMCFQFSRRTELEILHNNNSYVLLDHRIYSVGIVFGGIVSTYVVEDICVENNTYTQIRHMYVMYRMLT